MPQPQTSLPGNGMKRAYIISIKNTMATYSIPEQKRYGNKRTKDKELSATEVARLCGFSSLSRLSCNFRQYFNVTIREFRSHT